jgi:hypothetical protein
MSILMIVSSAGATVEVAATLVPTAPKRTALSIQSGLTGSTCNFSIGVEALCARTGTGVPSANRAVPRMAATANLNFPTFTRFPPLVLRRRNALVSFARPYCLVAGGVTTVSDGPPPVFL